MITSTIGGEPWGGAAPSVDSANVSSNITLSSRLFFSDVKLDEFMSCLLFEVEHKGLMNPIQQL
jgi:hypothetical protein